MRTSETMPFRYLKFVQFKDLFNWSPYSILGKQFSYNNAFPFAKISTFLKRNKTEVKVKNEVWYKRPTISMNNNGIKLRDEVLGNEIGTKNQFRISKGQFLLSKIDARNGAFGVVPIECDEGIITGNFWTFDVDFSKVYPEYLNLVTSSKEFHHYCQSASVGTTGRQYLQESLFLDIKIPLPTLEIQSKIVADFQRAIVEAEAAESRAVALEKEIEQYLNEVLGIEVRKTEAKKGLQFVQSKVLEKWGIEHLLGLTEVKRDRYPMKKIGELCKVGSGGTPSREVSDYYTGNIFWVKTTEVKNNIILETEEKITPLAIQNSSAKLYPAGSLLIAMYGQGATRGRTAKLGVAASTNQACAVLHQIKNEIVETDYLWFYIQNEYHRLRELASGNNQPNLNAEMVFNYEVVLPPIEIQKEIIKKITEMKEEIKALKTQAAAEREKAKRDFENMLFTGE